MNGDVATAVAISPPKPGTKNKLTVEKIYQKKTQLEHILLRPDTYIGSVEKHTELMWVYDGEEEGMVQREISYVPGLYKIFDEILVNAADNKQRDKKMDCIKVDIDVENNVVSIWNNGEGIPVVMHKEQKMYVPTMIFGHLLTSSNYNDEEQKITGGRNGYGAKLCNIFSTKFTVETASKKDKKFFKQTWAQNMGKASEPKIKESHDDFTRVTFSPDLAKFKMDTLDKDIVALMSRRAYDIAASSKGVKVFLNDKRVPVKNFRDYVELYLKDKMDEAGNPLKVAYESAGERWEIAVASSDKGFQQVSFVNSIATTKGGRHVDYVSDMVVKNVIETLKKKNKSGFQIKPFQIRNHMWVFANCLIVNPTFDSQTKENMTLQAKSFGSKCQPSEKFFGNVVKCGLVESVLAWARFKAQNQLNTKCNTKKQTKLKGVPKLEDANDAGTKNSSQCTLILTEGDSAKTLAVSGLSVVGRDRYGVFPLRGKLLNVREATHKQILENAEINNMIKILGLQYKKKYETPDDLKTLRYGKLMIMTDQDQDGSHIKGLLINFIHHNWPSLLRLPFLEEFITPIVKASKKSEEIPFFSLPEFEEWKRNKTNWHTYKIKYYKGLGTSTAKEAKEYFQDMQRHRIKFQYNGNQDDHHITMAFSKKCVDQRKEWLTNWMEECKRRKELELPEQYLYEKDTHVVNYTDFVNKELVLFSNLDNERSIPCLVDGFKPGQRKVVYTCIKRNDKREIKVAQLAGSVAEHSAYHHGETSLMSTIINLAQNYVGSNNLNLLQPIGQFGTRLQGGKDAASPRYIFTQLNPLTRLIFHPHDDALLHYLKDDNQRIEPEWYIPILPMVLVNGADGIGTGWMTKVPNYNPKQIVTMLLSMLNGEEPTPMTPWYRGFRGMIEPLSHQRYVINGELSILSNTKIEISELPVGTWTQTYKEQVLEPLLYGSEKLPAMISDYKEYHTDTTVRFVVMLSEDKLSRAEEEGLHKVFKIQTTTTTTSMVLFDEKGCIKKYETVEEIVKEFYTLRLTMYQKRKVYLEGMLGAEALKLSNQARFIMEKCDGKLVIENKKKKVMIDEMVKRGFDSDPVKAWRNKQDKDTLQDEATAGTESQEEEPVEADRDFEYLLGMPMWNLTLEKKNDIIRKKEEKQTELNIVKAKSSSDLWKEDLTKFSTEYDEWVIKEEAEASGTAKKGGKKAQLNPKESRNKKVAAETMPSPMGRRVEPIIDPELKKKAEKALAVKEGRVVKRRKGKESDDKDEFDDLVEKGQKSLADKVGNSPDLIEKKIKQRKKASSDGLKQSKLNFKKKEREPSQSPKKKGGKKGKNPWDSDESDEGSFNSGDDSIDIPVIPRERISARATATKARKYNFDSDEESEDEDVLYDNDMVKEEEDNPVIDLELESPKTKKSNAKKEDNSDEIIGGSDSEFESEKKSKKPAAKPKPKAAPKPPPAKRVHSDDSEDDVETPPKKRDTNTDALFDSLLGNNTSNSDSPPPKVTPKKAASKANGAKKPVAKKEPKKPAAPKRKVISDSDSDADSNKRKQKNVKKKVNSESGSDFEAGNTEPKNSSGNVRGRKTVKYNFSDSEDSD